MAVTMFSVFFDMGLLTDSRAGAGDGSARTGDVTRGRDHSTLTLHTLRQPTRATVSVFLSSWIPNRQERDPRGECAALLASLGTSDLQWPLTHAQ